MFHGEKVRLKDVLPKKNKTDACDMLHWLFRVYLSLRLELLRQVLHQQLSVVVADSILLLVLN